MIIEGVIIGQVHPTQRRDSIGCFNFQIQYRKSAKVSGVDVDDDQCCEMSYMGDVAM